MIDLLRRAHRFLSNQSFYPLVLASILALIFFTMRVIYSDAWYYRNLVWNLILAWIPYIFSMTAALMNLLLPKQWWLIIPPSLIWLLFIPNAPYIVTDFYHLVERRPVPLWYDIGLIAIYAFTGCFLAIASLRTMQHLVQKYLGTLLSWVFAFSVLGLCGLGIYLGRFGRWNSWDLLTNTQAVLTDIALHLLNPFENPRFIGFTLMFTAILMVFYLMFVSMNPIKQSNLSVSES
jgi:uncharacterized membrane protein